MLTLRPDQLSAVVEDPNAFAAWHLRAVMEPLLPEFVTIPEHDRASMTVKARLAADAAGMDEAGARAKFVHLCWTLGPAFHQTPGFREALAARGPADRRIKTMLSRGGDATAAAAIAAADPLAWRDPAAPPPEARPIDDAALRDRLSELEAGLARAAVTAAGGAEAMADLDGDLSELGRALILDDWSGVLAETAEHLPGLRSAAESDAFAARCAASRADTFAIEAILAARSRAGPGYCSGVLAADMDFIDRAMLDVGVAVAEPAAAPEIDRYPPPAAGRWIDPTTGEEAEPGAGAFLPDPAAHPALHAALARHGAETTGLPFRDGRPDFTVFAVRDRSGRVVRAEFEMRGDAGDLEAARAEAALMFGGWRKSIERGRVWVRNLDGASMTLVDGDVVTAWRRGDGGRLG